MFLLNFTGSTYDSRGSASVSSRLDSSNAMSKDTRYPDRSTSDFRGGSGRTDDRNGAKPRGYMDSSDNRYSDTRTGGSGGWHSGPPPVKVLALNYALLELEFNIYYNDLQTFNIPSSSNDIWNKAGGGADNGWRSGLDNSQDRYDRTYSERKTGPGSFMDTTSRPGFMGGGPVGGNRYTGPVSRYENGRF